MTDEERQKLVARLRAHEVVMWTDIDLAADEIERLAKELDKAHRLCGQMLQRDYQEVKFRTVERQPFTIGDEP